MTNPLRPGDLVDDSFRVLERLGSGTMGVVYLATDVRLGRRVALKLMRSDLYASRSFVWQFETEARALAGVRHPNVVQIYACGSSEGTPYIAMEHVDGVDLRSWFRDRDRDVDPLLVSQIVSQVAEGLGALHAANLIHRDLKPSNILITPDRRVAVADLGLSRRADGPQPGGSPGLVGTPAFLAPELVQRLELSPALAPRVDVYALAVLAYEFLTGQLPFRGADAEQTMKAHVDSEPIPPSRARPSLPSAVDAVLAQGLAKDPSHRTESAVAFADALRAALSPTASAPKILVVDDDPEHREMVQLWLEGEFPRARLQTADGGARALSLIEAGYEPDLLITDLHMPLMDGAELLRRLHEAGLSTGFPTVVVTGAGGASDWQALRKYGVDSFQLKPLDAQPFVTTVKQLLENRG